MKREKSDWQRQREAEEKERVRNASVLARLREIAATSDHEGERRNAITQAARFSGMSEAHEANRAWHAWHFRMCRNHAKNDPMTDDLKVGILAMADRSEEKWRHLCALG